MEQKIVNTLKRLGFEVECFEGGYSFEYEAKTFHFDQDEEFFKIFFEFADKDKWPSERKYYAFLEEFNSSLKCIKAYSLDGTVMLSYEREVIGDSDQDLEPIIESMIYTLEAAIICANEMFSSGEEEDEEAGLEADNNNNKE